MGEFKLLKDPIYGYVKVQTEYMNQIVDTSAFQRLRRIIQTSYSPLYSSALHNRFVHSIGVFHLGTLACASMKNEIEKKDIQCVKMDSIQKTFLLACLLHDVGHTPFSHTGERFLLDYNDDYTKLHGSLSDLVQSEDFKIDIPKEKSKSAAPHEVMSAIIGLREFSLFFADNMEKELFARCITGYKYSTTNEENSIKNCYIELLNSKIIDVDKLDYLIRDAYTTGFNTTNIDYQRLLNSLTIHNKSDKEKYVLAYHKSAISVIENVIYAHDSERKWIQTHPVVLYESYLLSNAIAELSKSITSNANQFFSLRALSSEGENLVINGHEQRIRLLCDDDVIYLMKNIYYESIGHKFFERNTRMRPAWKSEAEYKALTSRIATGGELFEKVDSTLATIAEYLEKSTETKIINQELLDKIETELKALDTAGLTKETYNIQKTQKEEMLEVIRYLEQFADENKLPFEFVLLKVSQFLSGFAKPDFANISIVFKSSTEETIKRFGDVASSIDAKEKARDSFYYLYYCRSKTHPANSELFRGLFSKFL